MWVAFMLGTRLSGSTQTTFQRAGEMAGWIKHMPPPSVDLAPGLYSNVPEVEIGDLWGKLVIN